MFKAISGSSLMGVCDPKWDKLNEEQKTQLTHLDTLERRGFDVTELKNEIVKKSMVDETDALFNK